MAESKSINDNALIDAQIQMRKIFISPVKQNNHYSLLFTRRFNKKKKKYTYYLYSADGEFLFAAATTLDENPVYSISLNANDIPSASWSSGRLQNTPNNQFTGISVNHESQNATYQNSIRIDLNPDQKIIQVKIAPPGQTNFIFVDYETGEFKPWILTQTKDPTISSNGLNFALNYNGTLSFNFNQIYLDEFQVICNYPLSLFQSFCICIAAASKMA